MRSHREARECGRAVQHGDCQHHGGSKKPKHLQPYCLVFVEADCIQFDYIHWVEAVGTSELIQTKALRCYNWRHLSLMPTNHWIPCMQMSTAGLKHFGDPSLTYWITTASPRGAFTTKKKVKIINSLKFLIVFPDGLSLSFTWYS